MIAVCAPLILSGIAVIVLAAAITWLLHLAGRGKPSGPRAADQWDWRVKDLRARRGHPDCLGCRMAGRRAEAAAPLPESTFVGGRLAAAPAPAPRHRPGHAPSRRTPAASVAGRIAAQDREGGAGDGR